MDALDEFEQRMLAKFGALDAELNADFQRLEAKLALVQQQVDEQNRKRREARAAGLKRQVIKAQKRTYRRR